MACHWFSSFSQMYRKIFTTSPVYLDNFILAQWPNLPCWIFPTFRVVSAAYFSCWLIANIVFFALDNQDFAGKWFIFLTNWAFGALVVQSVGLGVLVVKHTCIPRLKQYCHEMERRRQNRCGDVTDKFIQAHSDPLSATGNVEVVMQPSVDSGDRHFRRELTTFAKVVWVIDNVVSTMAIGIVITFWSFIYNGRDTLSVFSIHTHGVNVAYVIIDLILSGRPCWLSHIYQPILFGLVYVAFSVVYWAVGGRAPNGNPYVYKFLNWERPLQSVMFVGLFAVAFTALLYFTVYVVVNLRKHFYMRCSGVHCSEEHSRC